MAERQMFKLPNATASHGANFSNSSNINFSLYSRCILKIIKNTLFLFVLNLQNGQFRLGNHSKVRAPSLTMESEIETLDERVSRLPPRPSGGRVQRKLSSQEEGESAIIP